MMTTISVLKCFMIRQNSMKSLIEEEEKAKWEFNKECLVSNYSTPLQIFAVNVKYHAPHRKWKVLAKFWISDCPLNEPNPVKKEEAQLGTALR
mmetsp:Transcript_33956/g.39941  ORF Transcript_33956/g.39941 Transcript_33956/m.39941 type:complete len:93 (+) Transcript_33956:516-794(+)